MRLLSALLLLPTYFVSSCVPTKPSTTPTPNSQTTTTVNPADCCPALTQTLTGTTFPDGLMTFTYDSNTCRTMVNVTCSRTDTAFDLFAGIVANGQDFLAYGPSMVTQNGTCMNGSWFMAVPPLQINTISCELTNPP